MSSARSSSSILSLPRPPLPGLNLHQLRNDRHSRKATNRISTANSNRYHSSKESKSKASKYKDITLPRTFKFIVVPYNGTDSAPHIPRRSTNLYTAIEGAGMIKDILFTQGDAQSCLSTVREVFRHLELECFQFYQAFGNGSLLIRVSDISYMDFNLKNLQEYIHL